MVVKYKSLKIIVCDSFELFRRGVIHVLKEELNVFLVGEAKNWTELLAQSTILKPDLIITDLYFPAENSFKIIEQIKDQNIRSKILLLSYSDDFFSVYYASKLGCNGLVTKKISKEELIYAVSEIMEGKNYFHQIHNMDEYIKKCEKYLIQLRAYQKEFTERETDILELVGKGLSSEEIARILKIGKRTVDKTRSLLMQKVNIKTLPSFIKFAISYSEYKKTGRLPVDYLSN